MVDRSTTRIEELLAIRPITEAIAMEVKATPGYEHLEIINGEWIGLGEDRDEMTTGEEHGWIESLLLYALMGYALEYRAGRVYPGDVTFVLDGEPGDIRRMCEPDVAFVAMENVKPTEGFIFRAPDLAVEIVSPSQSYSEMSSKVEEYFQYGTKQVWLVLPDKQQIEIHFPETKPKKYGIGDTVTGGELLPGFSLDVATLFRA